VRTTRTIVALCVRTWRKTFRRPGALAFSFVQPVMWILFFGFLFQRYDVAVMTRGVRYVDFLVAGVCAMTVLFGSSQSGIGLLRDMQTGFLARMLRAAPYPAAVIAGKLIADVVRVVIQAFIIALIGMLIGARLNPSAAGIMATAAALGLFAVAFCSISCFVALKTGAQESMATFVHLVNMPLLFTSSALVPAKQMPEWLAAISRFNPLTATVDITRNALLGHEYSTVGSGLIGLVIFAMVALILTAFASRRVTVPA
jgi:ABC-2 type transport system permease protein